MFVKHSLRNHNLSVQNVPLHAQDSHRFNFVSPSRCFLILLSTPARHYYLKCVAGETLYISLEGINLNDADLSFSGEAANITLVRSVDGGMDV